MPTIYCRACKRRHRVRIEGLAMTEEAMEVISDGYKASWAYPLSCAVTDRTYWMSDMETRFGMREALIVRAWGLA